MNRKAIFAEDFEDVEDLMDTTLPNPELVEFYRGLKDREIVWNTIITDCIISVPLYIVKWNREDKGIPVEERKPIKIWINSDGGDTNVTLFLSNIIALSKTPVITIGMGHSYSSGGLLLMAGHKRLIFDSTSVLIHDGSSGAIGDTGKVIDNLEFTKEMEVRVRDFILKHTKIPADLLDKNYRRDWFLFSEDVIKYGIADKIITDIDEVI
ncbi:MAG: ATP-dependent Clp protease proteolytic subunit [Lachnospiraceae bacterium]|nr:ATP-dependent Clp protease proteolytic subunit [Lachnospiraceae bacterium]